MKEFTGFKPEHVGCKVTDSITGAKGIVEEFFSDRDYGVKVHFKNKYSNMYSADGFFMATDKARRLYFGHNIKVEVTGEKIPEAKLVCPVCKCEHTLGQWRNKDAGYYFNAPKSKCPLYFAVFPSKDDAKQTMKNLIKAMEKS